MPVAHEMQLRSVRACLRRGISCANRRQMTCKVAEIPIVSHDLPCYTITRKAADVLTGRQTQATKLAGFIQARSFPKMRRDPTRTKTSSHAKTGAVGPMAQNGPEGGSRSQAARPAFSVLE
jgi:hypothetical protein